MYTIGEFSVITGFSKKTLRYYDEINLLKPAKINVENNYRQYAEEQIPMSRKINNYKEFGLSLGEIRELVSDSSTLDIVKTLDFRLVSISKEIDRLKEQKKIIREYRKNNSKNEIDDMNRFTIKERVFESGNILSITRSAENNDIHNLINDLYHNASENELKITSNHYIRKQVDIVGDEENIEIFAYIDAEEYENISSAINTVKTLEIVCDDIKYKNKAYEFLINHTKQSNIAITEFIEEYKLTKGKLSVCINGVLEN